MGSGGKKGEGAGRRSLRRASWPPSSREGGGQPAALTGGVERLGAVGEAGRDDEQHHLNWEGPAPHLRRRTEGNTEAELLRVIPSALSSKSLIKAYPSVLETGGKKKNQMIDR